jgi:hypothetical protein
MKGMKERRKDVRDKDRKEIISHTLKCHNQMMQFYRY